MDLWMICKMYIFYKETNNKNNNKKHKLYILLHKH